MVRQCCASSCSPKDEAACARLPASSAAPRPWSAKWRNAALNAGSCRQDRPLSFTAAPASTRECPLNSGVRHEAEGTAIRNGMAEGLILNNIRQFRWGWTCVVTTGLQDMVEEACTIAASHKRADQASPPSTPGSQRGAWPEPAHRLGDEGRQVGRACWSSGREAPKRDRRAAAGSRSKRRGEGPRCRRRSGGMAVARRFALTTTRRGVRVPVSSLLSHPPQHG